MFRYQSVTHSSKLTLVPLNLAELDGSCGDFRASEEHLVVLGQVFALMSNGSHEMIDDHCFDLAKIRFPAVLGHRIFTRTFERELVSSKFVLTTKLIPLISGTESQTRTVQTKHV